MPYRVKLDIIKGSDDAKKNIDIRFPAGGAEIAKIFPQGKKFSTAKLIKATLEALGVSIKELIATQGYDETKVEYAGTHLVSIIRDELVFLHNIKNYEILYQVTLSAEVN